MELTKIRVAVLCACTTLVASAIPPMKYVTAVRNSQGKALAEKEMSFVVELLDNPTADEALYTETHQATSNSDGIVTLMIGEGKCGADASFDNLDWSGQRYVKVSVNADGSGYSTLSIAELGVAPIAMQSSVSRSLVVPSPNGTPWELKVSDSGSLCWNCLGEIPDTPPAYDETRIPEKLYFIGSFHGWNVSEALPMDKISKYVFTITRTIEKDEIFKFVPTQSWDNLYDWSGQLMKIGTPVPLREMGNTPKFSGETGTYSVTVDFHSFTMTISPL